MAGKRSKSGCKKRNGGGAAKGKRSSPRYTQKTDESPVQNPYDRVAFVRPFWESLSHEERVSLLTVSLDGVRQRAKEHAKKAKALAGKATINDLQTPLMRLEPRIEEILDEALGRVQEQSTWKLWQWGPETKPYTDAEAFRKDVEEEHFNEELRSLLPRDEGKPVEKPAEAGLRERMTSLLGQIHTQLQKAQEAWRRGQRAPQDQVETVVHDGNIDLVIAILEGLQQEHHCLYQTILTPVTDFVCGLLPVKNRKSNRTELFFEDLEKLPPEEVARLYEWLTEKVDSLCAKLKPDPKEEEIDEEESVGDIDLFSVMGERGLMTVNPKWLQHLQDRRLSDEGQPRKVKEGEDPHKLGLVLEWVYGSIVSTAEKARDGAKRPLGSWQPSVKQAKENLMTALRVQQDWEARAAKAKELLKRMLENRKEMAELGLDAQGDCQLSDINEELTAEQTEKVLMREELLTRAKLHVLQYERMMGDLQLRSLKAELVQGEPELERLKRELEEVKNTPRGLEGSFRTAAEKERHRAQLADSLLEEHLEVQSAFREQGARLQGIYDKRQRTEIDMAKREQEIKQLQGWQGNVNRMISRFQIALAKKPARGDSKPSGDKEALVPEPSSSDVESELATLCESFSRDFKRQLYTDQDDQKLFNRIKAELKQVEQRIEDGAVVLQHLEMFLINVACDDPGSAIGGILVLPLLQERMDGEALKFATHKASLAEKEILDMEKENIEKLSAEAAKKQAMKKKLKEKIRQAKVRKAAELKAKEEKERGEQEEHRSREREQLEEEIRRREAELARLRKEEEESIERRRQELLEEENGYWRLRMEAESLPGVGRAPASSPSKDPAEVNDSSFQPVSTSKRRAQERRQQQQSRGFHRRGPSAGRWSSGMDLRGKGHLGQHRRHRSADLGFLNLRSSNPSRDGKSADRQSLKPRHSIGQPHKAGSWQQNSGGQDTGRGGVPAAGRPKRTMSLPSPGTAAHAGRAKEAGTTNILSNRSVMEENKRSSARSGQESAVGKKSISAGAESLEQAAGRSTTNKPAWIKGEIPLEVFGTLESQEKQGPKWQGEQMLVVQSSSSSEVDKTEALSVPDTPEAIEMGASTVGFDNDNSVKNVTDSKAGLLQVSLPQIKTPMPIHFVEQKEREDDKNLGDQPVPPVADSTLSHEFEGSSQCLSDREGSLPKVDECNALLADAKPGHTIGDDSEKEVDDEVDCKGVEEEASPAPHMTMHHMGPVPYGVPLGGPMPSFHPGLFPHMPAAGAPMRPMMPMIVPSGFQHPPPAMHSTGTTSPPSSPQSSSAPSVSEPPMSTSPQAPPPALPMMGPVYYFPPMMPPSFLCPAAVPTPNNVPPTSNPQSESSPSTSTPSTSTAPSPLPSGGPPRIGPMYYFSPQIGPPGHPLPPHFMPGLPGQWVGIPPGPHFGRIFPLNDRPVKKFALRPNAKEFIPPSMLKKAAAEAEETASAAYFAEAPEAGADVAAVDAADSVRDEPVLEDTALNAMSSAESNSGDENITVQVNRSLTSCSCDEDIPLPDIVDASKAVVQPIEQKA